MKKIFLIALVLFSLFLSACPKKEKTFRKASESSAKLSIYGAKLIQANIDAFEAKEISLDTFKKLNAVTGKFVEGMKIYEAALDQAEKLIRENGNQIPAGTLERLARIFSDEVVAKFFDILREFDLISAEKSETVKTILAGIRLAILAIQDAFSDARQFTGGKNYGLV